MLKQVTDAPSNQGRSKWTAFFLSPIAKKKVSGKSPTIRFRACKTGIRGDRAGLSSAERLAYVATELAYLQPKDWHTWRQSWLIFSRKTHCSFLTVDSRLVNGWLKNAVQMAQAQKRRESPTRRSSGLCNNTILHSLLIYVTVGTRQKAFRFSLLVSTLGTLWRSQDTSRGFDVINP